MFVSNYCSHTTNASVCIECFGVAQLVDERDRYKALSEEYAAKVLEQMALVNEMREVVRLARILENTADVGGEVYEPFLDDLRAALKGCSYKGDSDG
jgi:hypothetical protein